MLPLAACAAFVAAPSAAAESLAAAPLLLPLDLSVCQLLSTFRLRCDSCSTSSESSGTDAGVTKRTVLAAVARWVFDCAALGGGICSQAHTPTRSSHPHDESVIGLLRSNHHSLTSAVPVVTLNAR